MTDVPHKTTPVVPLQRPAVLQPVEERVAAIEPLVALHGQRLDQHDVRFRENDEKRHGLTSDVDDVKERQTVLERRLTKLEEGMASILLIARHLKSWYAVGTLAAVLGGAVLNRVAPALPVLDEPAAVVSSQR